MIIIQQNFVLAVELSTLSTELKSVDFTLNLELTVGAESECAVQCICVWTYLKKLTSKNTKTTFFCNNHKF